MGSFNNMIYYKSHNDEWVYPQIYKALDTGCGIIEIDVIYCKNNVCLSHSWRPFPFMTYGNALKYFEFCKNYRGKKTIYLMIDIKTTNKKIIPILENYIFQFANDRVIFLIRFDKNNKKRKSIAEEIYNTSKIWGNIQIYEKWIEDTKLCGHEIVTLDLFKKLPWYKKLNQF
jgi:hypothetical protein